MMSNVQSGMYNVQMFAFLLVVLQFYSLARTQSINTNDGCEVRHHALVEEVEVHSRRKLLHRTKVLQLNGRKIGPTMMMTTTISDRFIKSCE